MGVFAVGGAIILDAPHTHARAVPHVPALALPGRSENSRGIVCENFAPAGIRGGSRYSGGLRTIRRSVGCSRRSMPQERCGCLVGQILPTVGKNYQRRKRSKPRRSPLWIGYAVAAATCSALARAGFGLRDGLGDARRLLGAGVREAGEVAFLATLVDFIGGLMR